LRTIGTVFRTTARLDVHQGAGLNFIGVEVLAMHRLGLKDQVVKRLIHNGFDFIKRPVVANVTEGHILLSIVA
jgi:hypothetical protein